MSFLLRGRSPWWWSDQSHPHAAEPAPEPVAAVTSLPVAAPAPAGVTDDLRAAEIERQERVAAYRKALAEFLAPKMIPRSEPMGFPIREYVINAITYGPDSSTGTPNPRLRLGCALVADAALKAIRTRLQDLLDTEDFSDDHLGVQRVIELLEER